jgi:hypothetical protein
LLQAFFGRVAIVIPFVMSACLAAMFWVAAALYGWPPAPFKIDLAAAIAVLATLIAAHVVAAELAAHRLPGLLARNSSFSPSVSAAYGTALALLGTAAAPKRLEDSATWATTVLIGLFAVLILVSMRDLIRRTDASVAAKDFVESRRLRYLRVGRRLGSLQRTAKEQKALGSSLTFVKLVPSPRHTVRRVSVFARKRGFLLLHPKRLRALETKTAWRSGLIAVDVIDSIGTVIAHGQEVAATIPDVSVTVGWIDRRRTSRLIAIKDSNDAEEVAEAAAVLVEMAARLGLSGDRGGAGRVARSLIEMLEAHMTGVKSTLDKAPADAVDPAPVVPAVRATIQSAGTHLGSVGSGIARDVLLHEVIEPLLALSRPSDGTIAMVVNELRTVDPNYEGRFAAVQMLEAAAIRAIDTQDHVPLAMVWQAFAQRLYDDGQPRPLVARFYAELAANAVWMHYQLGRDCWRRFWGATDRMATLGDRAIWASLVGGAALLSGTLSVALDVAMELNAAGFNMLDLQQQLRSRALGIRVITWSNYNGSYLGEHPAEAIADFGRFARRVTLAIRPRLALGPG